MAIGHTRLPLGRNLVSRAHVASRLEAMLRLSSRGCSMSKVVGRLNLNLLPRVTVFKLFVNEATKRTFTDVLHRGFQVGSTTTHLKVWNPDKDSGDGPDPDTASLYAIKSKRIWCEVRPSIAEEREKKTLVAAK